MTGLKTLLAATALTGCLAAPALAADVTIRNFAGTVEIVEGSPNLNVLQEGEKGDLDYSISETAILIDGGLSRKDRGQACNYDRGISWDLSFGNRSSRGDTRLEDYPHLEVRVPAGSTLTVEDTTMRLSVDVPLGAADLDIGGCFDTDLSDVEMLTVEKSGAGDFSVETVGTFTMEKSGAGDIEAGCVARFDLEQSGAGDVEIDRITEFAIIEKSGAGDVEIDRVDGDFTVEKSGAGDVEVGAGFIPTLSVRNSGAGDVEIDAAVGDAVVRASGAGDVYVESISGVLDETTSGAADFSRGDD